MNNATDFRFQSLPIAAPTWRARSACAAISCVITLSLLGGVIGLFAQAAPDPLSQPWAVICTSRGTG